MRSVDIFVVKPVSYRDATFAKPENLIGQSKQKLRKKL
jgi:hypothetical protein